jgi:hypothetical protein
MAAAVSLLLEREPSAFSIQFRRLSSSDRARAWRTVQRSSRGLPRISSSIPYSAPMRAIASVVVGEA